MLLSHTMSSVVLCSFKSIWTTSLCNFWPTPIFLYLPPNIDSFYWCIYWLTLDITKPSQPTFRHLLCNRCHSIFFQKSLLKSSLYGHTSTLTFSLKQLLSYAYCFLSPNTWLHIALLALPPSYKMSPSTWPIFYYYTTPSMHIAPCHLNYPALIIWIRSASTSPSLCNIDPKFLKVSSLETLVLTITIVLSILMVVVF